MRINQLYQNLINRIRRLPEVLRPPVPQRNALAAPAPQPALTRPIVPFAMGRVYKCAYTNWKHDPRPLVFILSSDAFYTHAINVHYLGGLQQTLLRIILNMRQSNQPLTGYIMYRFLKMRAPGIPRAGYRKYFTKYLLGKLVSDGVSQIPAPGKALLITEPFVRQLNNLIRPRVIGKVTMTATEAKRIADEMGVAEQEADQSQRGVDVNE
jgi:hypothetical protein